MRSTYIECSKPCGKERKDWKKAEQGQRHIKLDSITPGRIGAYQSAHHDTQGAQE